MRRPVVVSFFLLFFSCCRDPFMPIPDGSEIRRSDGFLFLNAVCRKDFDPGRWEERGWTVVDSFASSDALFYHVALPETESAVLSEIRGWPGVSTADFDTMLTLNQSGEPLMPTLYGRQLCSLDDLWSDTDLKRNFRVAVVVVDSGINPLHEEVSEAFTGGWSAFERSATGAYTYLLDDLSSDREKAWVKMTDNVTWDAVTGTAHGTAVSSIIGGNGRNGKGFSGVVPDLIDIYILKGFAATAGGVTVSGSGSSWALYSGLQRYVCGYTSAEHDEEDPVSWKEWTHDGLPYRQKTLPINASYGASVTTSFEMFVLKKLWENDAVVIAASGNEGFSSVCYPSAYSFVLSVGAVDADGRRPLFSNYGENLDMAAPGVSVPTADGTETNGYRWGDGTSYAAPFVTGTAAYMLSVKPDLNKRQLFSILKTAVTQPAFAVFTDGFNVEYGCGIIDAHEAVRLAKSGNVSPVISSADLEVSVKGDDPTRTETYFFYLYDDRNRLTAAHPSDSDGNVFFGALSPGNYRLEISLPEAVASVDPARMAVTVTDRTVSVDGFDSTEIPSFFVTFR